MILSSVTDFFPASLSSSAHSALILHVGKKSLPSPSPCLGSSPVGQGQRYFNLHCLLPLLPHLATLQGRNYPVVYILSVLLVLDFTWDFGAQP